jgi:hypothetical protein
LLHPVDLEPDPEIGDWVSSVTVTRPAFLERGSLQFAAGDGSFRMVVFSKSRI